MLDREEWCIVKFYGELGPDLLIRKRYQWEAQRLSHQWEYVAEGLTKEEADAYTKLFKE